MPPEPPYPLPPDPEEPPYETRPRFSRGDLVPLLDNGVLARIFAESGDMMDLKGELVFKGVAYRRAADAIAHSGAGIAEAYRAGDPPRLPGVGKAINDKLAELADTGRLRFYERLRREIPPGLLDLVEVPGLGPRSIRELHQQLGISTLEDLERAARAGRIREVRGMGARTEERILEGLAARGRRSERLRLGQAAELLGSLLGDLAGTPGLRALVPAGSFRRRRETIGDLDLLAETDDPAALVARFVGLASAERVVNRGSHKAAIELRRGPQVDLMVMPPGATGSYLVHFTGSAAHNVRLRGVARERGWSLSENGFLRLDEAGQPLTGPAAELRTFATEEEVYRFLDLPWIAPELREDEGEIEAAQGGTLPLLVELRDLQGDCHSHSDWSDGRYSVEQMAEEARRRGLAYQVLTDHTQSLGIARGLGPARVAEQRRLIDDLNARFAREEAEGRLPPGAHPDGFRILHGCELEIRADGELDYPDRLLADFDLVCASLHVGRRQPRRQLMTRYRAALRNPHVDVISHPSGRKIGERDDLDLDWDEFYGEAARSGTWLEINGSDERLDLAPGRVRRARAAGCRFAIDSDAHFLHEFDNLAWGVAMARRGWLERDDVLNTRSRGALLEALRARG
jgi:DNA polymerase (family X)